MVRLIDVVTAIRNSGYCHEISEAESKKLLMTLPNNSAILRYAPCRDIADMLPNGWYIDEPYFSLTTKNANGDIFPGRIWGTHFFNGTITIRGGKLTFQSGQDEWAELNDIEEYKQYLKDRHGITLIEAPKANPSEENTTNSTTGYTPRFQFTDELPTSDPFRSYRLSMLLC